MNERECYWELFGDLIFCVPHYFGVNDTKPEDPQIHEEGMHFQSVTRGEE